MQDGEQQLLPFKHCHRLFSCAYLDHLVNPLLVGLEPPLAWQNGAPPSYLPVGGIHTPVLLNVREGVTGFTYKNCDMGGNIGPKGTGLHTTMNICCGVR